MRSLFSVPLIALALVAGAVFAAPVPAKKPVPAAKPAVKPAPKPAAPAPPADPSVAFFRDGVIPRLKIQISAEELNTLRQKNREYVKCTIVEDDKTTYENAGIHLKGAAGSFRGVDDHPALTVSFDKFKDDQSFHNLDKIHLNNSVQDPGYMDELLCSDLFLAAGVPTQRVTHARVWLNGRDLGLYVLKEGFNKDFLRRNHLDPAGNLYEGGFCQDLDGHPQLHSGKGPKDLSDVKAVVAACREPDQAKRWQRVEQVVDIDKFLNFMAMEELTCHWDGYCNNRNNYRYYIDPKTNKLQFFPAGMDQMFRDPNSQVLFTPGAMVPQAVMSNPQWKDRYRERAAALAKMLVPPDRILKRVEEIHLRLIPVFAEMGQGQVQNFDNQVRSMKERLVARAKSLEQQKVLTVPPPTQTAKAPAPAKPAGLPPLIAWEPRKETPDARVERVDSRITKPGNGMLLIAAGKSGRCVASWRMRVTLPAGTYRFEAKASTQGVKALQEPSGTGAGIRISGGQRTNKLEGTAGPTLLTYEIQIPAPVQEVELVAELRATAGSVMFDYGSMKLVRVK